MNKKFLALLILLCILLSLAACGKNDEIEELNSLLDDSSTIIEKSDSEKAGYVYEDDEVYIDISEN